MLKAVVAGVLAAAVTSPVLAQDHSTQLAWEVGLAFGRDFDTDENLWAVSGARRFGDGWKGVLEYADGKHGHHGSTVTSLKLVKDVAHWGQAEFGLGFGGAYVYEEHHDGGGLLFSAEAAYSLTPRWALKAEASYLLGLGKIDEIRAWVLQAGIVFRF